MRAPAACFALLSLGGAAPKLESTCITEAAPGPTSTLPQKMGLEHSGTPGCFLKDEKLGPGERGRELTLTECLLFARLTQYTMCIHIL